MKEEGKVSWEEPESMEAIIIWAENDHKMPTDYCVFLWSVILFIVFGIPALFWVFGQ